MLRSLLLASLALGVGCSYDEGLMVDDLTGTVVLPASAATRTFIGSDGSERAVTDPRLIGPVTLGLFAGVQEGLTPYLHPNMGPQFRADVVGDANPYGGTTVGDVRFPCLDFLTCKVVSGRYVDFDDMVSWFADTLNDPIIDAYGQEVQSGDYLRQTCYSIMNYTSDDEIRLTVTSDQSGDGIIDEQDLDFVYNEADDTYEADFIIRQVQFIPGYHLWGWMDAPSEASYRFSTCQEDAGFQETDYTTKFNGGRQAQDLLNFPSKYIATGDWVASESHEYLEVDDVVRLVLDDRVEK